MLMTVSLINIDQSSPIRKRIAFSWGLRGYRGDTTEIFYQLRSRVSSPFCKEHSIRDEARWLALYVTDDFYTMDFLIAKTGLRREALEAFCLHYGVNYQQSRVITEVK